jgi:hypothetical protein
LSARFPFHFGPDITVGEQPKPGRNGRQGDVFPFKPMGDINAVWDETLGYPIASI